MAEVRSKSTVLSARCHLESVWCSEFNLCWKSSLCKYVAFISVLFTWV